MKFRNLQAAIAATLLASLDAMHTARADMLYEGVGFITGQQTLTDTFTVSGPGLLTVTLQDFAWPTTLASLDMTVSSFQGVLGPEFGVGTQSFNIASASTLYAQWFGTPQGALNAGLYGVSIQFTPSGTTVPLPPSVALLLSGLCVLLWRRRPGAAGATDAARQVSSERHTDAPQNSLNAPSAMKPS